MNLDNVTLKNKIEKKQLETIKITVEGKEYDLEVEKYYFEYPKHVQKETGILGYEKAKISQSQIDKILEDFKNATKNQIDFDAEFTKNILDKLSDGRFPNESFNYAMGIRNSENMEDRAHNAQFTEEKFTLQDVFSWDGYFGLKEKGISMPYKISDRDPEHSQFDLFEKSSQRYINSSSYVGFMYDKVNKNLNNDKIHEDEIMIVSANGLNVMPYRFFGHFSLRNKNLKGFGFDREDSFFQDYLKKATELLRNLNNENDSEENHIPATTTHNAERIHKLYSNGIFTNVFGLMDASHEKIDFKELPAKDLVMKYGGALNSKDAGDMYYDIDNLNLNIPFNDRYDYKRRSNEYVGNFGKGKDLDYFRDLNPGIRSSTPSIPVFVNSNDVPQLKWGHASYASFWTNNAFNFLKIKHTDHLPKHEETAE